VPKIVDHDAQRQRFCEAAMRLIARDGMEGLTMRAVAAEAQLSYGSLFHYFDSKEALLTYAIRHLMESQTRRVNEFSSRLTGLRSIEELLCDDAVVDSSSRDGWLVWVAFLYKAALHREFAAMNTDLIRGWLGRIEAELQVARESGEVAQDLDIESEAMAIWVFSSGLGQSGLLHPEWLPPARQKAMIKAYLQRLEAG
jgi:DNA-binding transcriptional regulator YbjK